VFNKGERNATIEIQEAIPWQVVRLW